MMKPRGRWRLTAAAAVILAALPWVGCNDDNELEPGEGAGLSIDLSPIVVCEGGTSEVEVTLFDGNGNCLDGVPVTLSVEPSPPGALTVTAGVTDCGPPILPLTSTFSSSTAGTYTVTVTGGAVTGLATLTVVAPGAGMLTLVAPDPDVNACSSTSVETVAVTGTRLDGTTPLSGHIIALKVVASPNLLGVSLAPTPVVTASDGTYSASLVLDDTTCAPCVGSPTPACTVTVRVVSDCVESADLTLTESF